MKSSVQDKALSLLYETVVGRKLLKLLVYPSVSRVAGKFLDSSFSTVLIKPFLKSTKIDMSEYEKCRYESYNDFFTRKVKEGARPIDADKEHLISPCDGAALLLPIDEKAQFSIKKSCYNVRRLLRSKKLAEKYQGGMAVILRLAVDNYHRYCYVDDGVISTCREIKGVLHTVQPIANDYYPIYHENTREYCILHSENFQDIVVMEVGALLVGRIVNNRNCGKVKRGEEKGRFEFGGSTIVLLLEKDVVNWREDILEHSKDGKETPVKMGEVIGRK